MVNRPFNSSFFFSAVTQVAWSVFLKKTVLTLLSFKSSQKGSFYVKEKRFIESVDCIAVVVRVLCKWEK